MNNKLLVLASMALMLSSTAYAAGTAGCDEKLTNALNECQRLVGSLRADKAGQMRVFASDGSEFTAGQAQWMKNQLRLVAKACADGDVTDAARRLSDVQELLQEHRRSFS
jgi:phage-related minor tail protein